jgi:hypothetical protein
MAARIHTPARFVPYSSNDIAPDVEEQEEDIYLELTFVASSEQLHNSNTAGILLTN